MREAVEEKYLILSDIHGNLSAFEAVLADCQKRNAEGFHGVIITGDCIDYGMRSNEVLQRLQELAADEWQDRIVANLWGNHEKLVIDKDLERLSSDRGRQMAAYTAEHLTDNSLHYLAAKMNKQGWQSFRLGDYNGLAVHGSLEDNFWKAIAPDNLRGDYRDYDIVISGHSHYSHAFTHFYPCNDEQLRNKKAVIFINPGSVGQPRNQNPYAQYGVLSLPSRQVDLRAVPYDVGYEQSLFPKEIDQFYHQRLTRGI